MKRIRQLLIKTKTGLAALQNAESILKIGLDQYLGTPPPPHPCL